MQERVDLSHVVMLRQLLFYSYSYLMYFSEVVLSSFFECLPQLLRLFRDLVKAQGEHVTSLREN